MPVGVMHNTQRGVPVGTNLSHKADPAHGDVHGKLTGGDDIELFMNILICLLAVYSSLFVLYGVSRLKGK